MIRKEVTILLNVDYKIRRETNKLSMKLIEVKFRSGKERERERERAKAVLSPRSNSICGDVFDDYVHSPTHRSECARRL